MYIYTAAIQLKLDENSLLTVNLEKKWSVFTHTCMQINVKGDTF